MQIREQNEQRIVLESGTIIDKSTKSIIIGNKYSFWGNRTIPFSDVIGVVVYSKDALEGWWGMGSVWLWTLSKVLPLWAVDQLYVSNADSYWLVCINYRGGKQTMTEVVAYGNKKDEEDMLQLKEIIRSAIGK